MGKRRNAEKTAMREKARMVQRNFRGKQARKRVKEELNRREKAEKEAKERAARLKAEHQQKKLAAKMGKKRALTKIEAVIMMQGHWRCVLASREVKRKAELRRQAEE